MSQLQSHPRLVRKLQEALGDQLCVALDDANVVEITLNPDVLHRAPRSRRHARRRDVAVGAETVIGAVAHALQSEIDAEKPIISGELPIGGHRFEGLLPPSSTDLPSPYGVGHHISLRSTSTFGAVS